MGEFHDIVFTTPQSSRPPMYHRSFTETVGDWLDWSGGNVRKGLLKLHELNGGCPLWLSIVEMTILTRIAVFPLRWRAWRNGQRLQQLQAEVATATMGSKPKTAAAAKARCAAAPETLQRMKELADERGLSPWKSLSPLPVAIPLFLSVAEGLRKMDFHDISGQQSAWLGEVWPGANIPVALMNFAYLEFQRRRQSRGASTFFNSASAPFWLGHGINLVSMLWLMQVPAALNLYILTSTTLSLSESISLSRVAVRNEPNTVAAFSRLFGFVKSLCKAVEGRSATQITALSLNDDGDARELRSFQKLQKIMRKVKEIIDETPPEAMNPSQRYGNPAFRQLIPRIRDAFETWPDVSPFQRELLQRSWGNETRIDYGTGHELFFLIFILCEEPHDKPSFSANYYAKVAIEVVGFGGRSPSASAVGYLSLAALVQDRYSLEPAGSHGVWGLDDYHFLPFLLGSSQLIDNCRHVQPADLVRDSFLESSESLDLSKEYLYIWALRRLHALKCRPQAPVPFARHSPLLYDISALPTWRRIHDGLGRMWVKEVCSKFPVVQHLLFSDPEFPFEAQA